MAKITPLNTDNDIIGYILAGGESRRFNYQTKGLTPLKQKPMIHYVIERFKPQVTQLNINSHFVEYSQFDLPTVGETETFLGPLAGIFRCMQHMLDNYQTAQWLAIAPCDAPFLPNDMIQRFSTAQHSQQPFLAHCFLYDKQLQPTFSLWHKSLFNDLNNALTHKQWRSVKTFLHSLDDKLNVVEYPKQTISPFFNINTEQDRDQAAKILEKHSTE